MLTRPGAVMTILSLAMCLPEGAEQSIAQALGHSMPLKRTHLFDVLSASRPVGLNHLGEAGGQKAFDGTFAAILSEHVRTELLNCYSVDLLTDMSGDWQMQEERTSAQNRDKAQQASRQKRDHTLALDGERWVSQLGTQFAGLQRLGEGLKAHAAEDAQNSRTKFEPTLPSLHMHTKPSLHAHMLRKEGNGQHGMATVWAKMWRERAIRNKVEEDDAQLLVAHVRAMGSDDAERERLLLASEVEREDLREKEREKKRLFTEAARFSSKDAMTERDVQVLRQVCEIKRENEGNKKRAKEKKRDRETKRKRDKEKRDKEKERQREREKRRK